MRRSALLLAVAAVVVAALPASAQDPQADDAVRVLHLTVDSLHPSEVGPQTPTLQSLKDSGIWYEQARAVMAAETLPNHVAMATGTYPGRNGIPGNSGRARPGDQSEHTHDADGSETADLGDGQLLDAASFVTAIETACPALRTVQVFSKIYVDNIFQDDPVDRRFPQEAYNIPGSGHALDVATGQFILDELNAGEPFDYLFANLGDVDRAGHVDETGFTGVPALRQGVLQQTDAVLQSIVATLQQQGLWESTVLVISSDHAMDYTNLADPGAYVDVAGALEADPRTAGRFFVGENGGAALVYLREPASDDADEVLRDAREVLTGLDGVHEALYRRPNPLEPGADLDAVHPDWHLSGTHRAGELFVTVRPGHKVSTPLTAGPSNPIPGNHGHAITRHAVALVTGGWDGLAAPTSVAPSDPDAVDTEFFDDTAALPEQAEQVDYAPTFGWLLGVPDPGLRQAGAPQWQGRVLAEAFERRPAPRCQAADASGDGEPAPSEPAPSPAPDPAPDAGAAPTLPATGGGTVLGIGALMAALATRRR